MPGFEPDVRMKPPISACTSIWSGVAKCVALLPDLALDPGDPDITLAPLPGDPGRVIRLNVRVGS